MEKYTGTGRRLSPSSLCAARIITEPKDLNSDRSAEIIILNGFQLIMLSKASKKDLITVLKKDILC